MFTGFVAIFIFPTVKDGILSHISCNIYSQNQVFTKLLPGLSDPFSTISSIFGHYFLDILIFFAFFYHFIMI